MHRKRSGAIGVAANMSQGIPKTVKVGPHAYAVKRVPNLVRNRDCNGETSHDERELRIDEGLTGTHELKTFVHELCHAMAEERDMDIEEANIAAFAGILTSVIVDNEWRIRTEA